MIYIFKGAHSCWYRNQLISSKVWIKYSSVIGSISYFSIFWAYIWNSSNIPHLIYIYKIKSERFKHSACRFLRKKIHTKSDINLVKLYSHKHTCLWHWICLVFGRSSGLCKCHNPIFTYNESSKYFSQWYLSNITNK